MASTPMFFVNSPDVPGGTAVTTFATISWFCAVVSRMATPLVLVAMARAAIGVELAFCAMFTVHEVPDPETIVVPGVTPGPSRVWPTATAPLVTAVTVSAVPAIDPVNVAPA